VAAQSPQSGEDRRPARTPATSGGEEAQAPRPALGSGGAKPGPGPRGSDGSRDGARSRLGGMAGKDGGATSLRRAGTAREPGGGGIRGHRSDGGQVAGDWPTGELAEGRPRSERSRPASGPRTPGGGRGWSAGSPPSPKILHRREAGRPVLTALWRIRH
jgi:hypothetical protein